METQVNYWMADYYYNKALYDLSIEAGEKAMIASSHIKDKQQQSDVFSVLGIAHYRKGYFEVALQYFRKGYDIDKQLDNDENMSSDLNNLSSVYLALRQPDAAAVYIERAIELERKLDHPERMAIRLGMASEIYLAKKDYDKALALATEAYKLDSSQGRPLKAAIRQSQMAAVYIEMGKLDEAQNAITRAIAQIEHDGAKAPWPFVTGCKVASLSSSDSGTRRPSSIIGHLLWAKKWETPSRSERTSGGFGWPCAMLRRKLLWLIWNVTRPSPTPCSRPSRHAS